MSSDIHHTSQDLLTQTCTVCSVNGGMALVGILLDVAKITRSQCL